MTKEGTKRVIKSLNEYSIPGELLNKEDIQIRGNN